MITNFEEILKKTKNLNLNNYSKTRNYLNGSVTKLSPYVSRGMISTRFIFEQIIGAGKPIKQYEKFIQELAWRDYWQLVWKHKDINQDLKRQQEEVNNNYIPKNIIEAHTKIEAIDYSIKKLYDEGYVHNHVRMYIASIVCNIAKCHWKNPAKWFYYHLIDADWGSNALSWQWVCGTNSSKKYYANQANINHFCNTNQTNTFLDHEYSVLSNIEIPKILSEVVDPNLDFNFQCSEPIEIDNSKPILVYNFYNVDPMWRKDLDANRVMLIEPSVFREYPVSPKSINFLKSLSKNIDGIKFYIGEFEDLSKNISNQKIYYKEHPLNKNYHGSEDKRDWLFENDSYYPSFFKFWNKNKKSLGL